MSTNRKSDNWSEYEIHPQLVAIEDAQDRALITNALLRIRVMEARELGVTWSAIADVLEMNSKQAAQQRFAPKD